MPTLLPQMMGFGSYFLQTSLGKILNQLHSKRLDEVAEQFESHRELMSPSTADSEGTEGTEGKESPAPTDPQGLDAVRRILETVNTSVTKQLLEANVRKLSTSPATMKREFEEDYQVRWCVDIVMRILLFVCEKKVRCLCLRCDADNTLIVYNEICIVIELRG